TRGKKTCTCSTAASTRAAGPQIDQRRDIARLAVIDRYVLGHRFDDRLQLGARVGQGLFAIGNLLLRSDPDDVAVAALVESLGLQDDIERLVPRHVDQAQRDAATDA